MRIAVTGAAGFVGSAVVAAARERGDTVVALTRRVWDITTGPHPAAPLLAAPSVAPRSVAAPSLDVVVHAAAAVTDRGDPRAVWRANLLGTRHVVTSFPGVRLVHVSSASVYDPFVPTVFAPESAAPVDRYLNAYGASKAAAERLLAGRPDTVVLRPHAVYGPGDPTLLPRLLAAIRGRTLLLPGDGRSRHTLTAIGTLVDAVLRACEPDAPPGVYNVGDAYPVVLDDVVRALLAARNLDVRIRYVPLVLARLPPATRYAVSHLGRERTLDLTAARARLGLDPPATSLAGAAEW